MLLEFWIINGWPISRSNIEAQRGPITQPYVYNFSLHSQSLACGHVCRQQDSRQVSCCDITLLAAEFSSWESQVVIVWAYDVVIFMLDCWSLILLWTCCIYAHSWFWCFRFEVPLSINIDIYSIWWFHFGCIDFSLLVSFSSISFPYRFRVKNMIGNDNAYFRSFPTDFIHNDHLIRESIPLPLVWAFGR
jgi:hypothetical protein